MEGSWFELSPTPTHHALGSTKIGSVTYGDVSGDGLADEVGLERLPCGDCEDTLSLIVAEGDGTGRFGEPTYLDTCVVGFSYWKFWLADLNGDGDSEYVLDTRCGDDPEQPARVRFAALGLAGARPGRQRRSPRPTSTATRASTSSPSSTPHPRRRG